MQECNNPLKASTCDYSCRGKQGILCLLSKCRYKKIKHSDYERLMQHGPDNDIDIKKCRGDL